MEMNLQASFQKGLKGIQWLGYYNLLFFKKAWATVDQRGPTHSTKPPHCPSAQELTSSKGPLGQTQVYASRAQDSFKRHTLAHCPCPLTPQRARETKWELAQCLELSEEWDLWWSWSLYQKIQRTCCGENIYIRVSNLKKSPLVKSSLKFINPTKFALCKKKIIAFPWVFQANTT